MNPSDTKGWRADERFYRKGKLGMGQVFLSPCWYQQGHWVSAARAFLFHAALLTPHSLEATFPAPPSCCVRRGISGAFFKQCRRLLQLWMLFSVSHIPSCGKKRGG